MKNPIILGKTYQLQPDYNTIKTNHREQVLLLFSLHQLTGLIGSELVEHYVDLIIPMVKKFGEQGYSGITSHRAKRRKHINYLHHNYLIFNN